MNNIKINKKILFFFLKTLFQHKTKASILIFYSLICGYLFPFWVNLIKDPLNNKLKLITLFSMEISFEYIKDLLLFSIYNDSIFSLKKEKTHQQLFQEIKGNIITQFQRSSSIKYIFRNFFTILKELTSILSVFYILYLEKFLFIFIFILTVLYFYIYFFLQNKMINLRNEAWSSSEESSNTITKSIEQHFAIKQNLISEDEAMLFLEKERNNWHVYYLWSNLYFIFLSCISIIILMLGIILEKIILIEQFIRKLNKLMKTCKNTYISFSDIQIFFQDSKINLTQIYSKNLIIENLHIPLQSAMQKKILGPLNFINKEKMISISGNNATGKTSLALAIANLIPYQGIIKKPKTIYISLENSPINKELSYISKGEKALYIIDLIISKNYELLILDEILDILSDENLKSVINKLKTNKASVIIITHKKNIENFTNTQYELTSDFKLIEKFKQI